MDPYPQLLAHVRTLAHFQAAAAVLQWDQQTYLPPRAAEGRGDTLAALAAVTHEKATDPRVNDWLDACAFPADTPEAANVREIRRTYDRAVKLPAALVAELAKVTARAHETWVEARRTNTFTTFRPDLERILELKREEAAAVGYTAHIYDALLDEYEPGMTAAQLTPLFADLTRDLAPLIRQFPAADTAPLTKEFAVEKQKWFAEGAAAAIGFDFDAGRLDTAAHPFCTTFGPHDVRITTRYNPKAFNEAFFGVLHEAGHGIYEQNIPAEHYGTPLGSYCSLGIHESQSRLWENQVGRGGPFWKHFFPRLRQAFQAATRGVTAEAFLKAVNAVKPSFIRVEADEATYNLHVAVRFELELALLTGDLPVADLPAAWAEKYREYLGIAPPTDADGCLQDVHWSFGGFGYFPTYTLGNLAAAQLFAAAKRAVPGLEDGFTVGHFAPLKDWLTAHVHVHGRRYASADLIRRATGADLGPASFLQGIREKLSDANAAC